MASHTTRNHTRILGASAATQTAIARAKHLAQFDCPVLITGETGTGKELFARLIHDASSRARKPFVAINCAAITESLAESELFGHVAGSFTGASSDYPGKIGDADGGTLFLDEIGEMNEGLQTKLLRVLQDHMVCPVGGRPRKIDFRVVAATNKDLEKTNSFRRDLFYRLVVTQIHLLPLRERREDIEPIANAIIEDLAARYNVRSAVPLDVALLQRLPWYGNVRELASAVERHVLSAEYCRETPVVDTTVLGEGFSLCDHLAAVERALCAEAVSRCQGNFSEAARLLGINRTTLCEKLRRYGLNRPVHAVA